MYEVQRDLCLEFRHWTYSRAALTSTLHSCTVQRFGAAPLNTAALEGMVNGKKIRGRRRYQMIDNIDKCPVWRYEKEGWEEGKMENAEFAVKDLPLGRRVWLIDDWY